MATLGMNYTPLVTEPVVHVLTEAPQGGWTIPSPAAYTYNGYTYFGYLAHTGTGPVKVAVYTHATQTVGTPIQLATNLTGGQDDHNNPSLLVDSVTHKLVVAYCGHIDIRMRVRVSVNSLDSDPTLSGGFATALNLNDAPINTYAMLVQVNGVSGSPIFLFGRNLPNTTQPTTTRMGYWVSTDAFATYPTYTLLWTAGTGERAYWAVGSDWDTRIDIATTQGDPGDAGVTLHHMYINATAGTYHKTDGTQIVTALPFTTADMTQFYDGSDGSPFPQGVGTDGGGDPFALYVASFGGTGEAVRMARWRTGAWQTDEIIDNTGQAVNDFWPGAAVDPFNLDRVWSSRLTGSYFELSEFTSADDGATWDETVITSGSTAHNSNMMPVYYATDALRVVWLHGPANSYGIWGLSTP